MRISGKEFGRTAHSWQRRRICRLRYEIRLHESHDSRVWNNSEQAMCCDKKRKSWDKSWKVRVRSGKIQRMIVIRRAEEHRHSPEAENRSEKSFSQRDPYQTEFHSKTAKPFCSWLSSWHDVAIGVSRYWNPGFSTAEIDFHGRPAMVKWIAIVVLVFVRRTLVYPR